MDFTESEVNLALGLCVHDELVRRGYRVLLTRDGDYMLNADREDVNGDGEVNHVDEAQARVDMINAAGADLLLSIHQNNFKDDTASGPVTYYCAARPFSDRSLFFAHLVQDALIEAFRSLDHDVYTGRGVQQDAELITPGKGGDYIILLGPKTERIVRPCQVPGVLSETAFLSCPREAELIRDPKVLDRLAQAYADAVGAYLQEYPVRAIVNPGS